MSKHVGKVESHEIREMFKHGMSKQDISYATGRSRPTIDRVLSNKTREIDKRVDLHDRFLGPLSTGNYTNGIEDVEFADPTADAAESALQIERLSNVKLLKPKEF